MLTIQGIQGEEGIIPNLQMKKQSLRVNILESKACMTFHSRGLASLETLLLAGSAPLSPTYGKYLNTHVLSLNQNAVPGLSHLPQWSCAVTHAATSAWKDLPDPGSLYLVTSYFPFKIRSSSTSTRKSYMKGISLSFCCTPALITGWLSPAIWTDPCTLYLYSWQTTYFEKIKERTLKNRMAHKEYYIANINTWLDLISKKSNVSYWILLKLMLEILLLKKSVLMDICFC